MNELTTLIQQALDSGDTATARALSRTLENQTRISTRLEDPFIEDPDYCPEQQRLITGQVYNPQPQYLGAYHEPVEYYEPVVNGSQKTISISTLVCLVILPYLAIAEVLAPGHQGPLKIHETNLDWPIEMIGGVFPKGDSANAQSE